MGKRMTQQLVGGGGGPSQARDTQAWSYRFFGPFQAVQHFDLLLEKGVEDCYLWLGYCLRNRASPVMHAEESST